MNDGHVSLAVSDDLKFPLLPVVSDDEPYQRQTVGQHLRTIFTPKNCYIALGPLLCAVVCLCARLGGEDTSTARNMLGVLVWIFAWWITEAVPMPITSMSPLFLFPIFGIAAADDVASSYMDDVIALVLGSFILALAVEHYNIHRRLALNILHRSIGSDMPTTIANNAPCSTIDKEYNLLLLNAAPDLSPVPISHSKFQISKIHV